MNRLLRSLPLSGVVLCIAAALSVPAPAPASPCGCGASLADCNANGVEDAIDIASGASSDLDLDGVPDECEERQRR